ncbi:hypothetical protein THAOC_33468 [Thalassiosira oceanica]|uniref:Uncharacterized protein n=1 Tax=Thalassiosira oceanica TaxID=159749 RepID=K0RM44_THAOC|nr:hypothetical protein THAOC_33468 [Thalassiosira oceanica]|eukprot:EJK47792.1 hypothetical protein THAOC_33468 [Thalassiosira oceanica]
MAGINGYRSTPTLHLNLTDDSNVELFPFCSGRMRNAMAQDARAHDRDARFAVLERLAANLGRERRVGRRPAARHRAVLSSRPAEDGATERNGLAVRAIETGTHYRTTEGTGTRTGR